MRIDAWCLEPPGLWYQVVCYGSPRKLRQSPFFFCFFFFAFLRVAFDLLYYENIMINNKINFHLILLLYLIKNTFYVWQKVKEHWWYVLCAYCFLTSVISTLLRLLNLLVKLPYEALINIIPLFINEVIKRGRFCFLF